MRKDIPELVFASRSDLREWLNENSETSEGVWLLLGKTKAFITLSANDALEEALCFGWIDGQMQSIDETRYKKYFAKRRTKSVWSEKNKKITEALRENGMMTPAGERAVEEAKKNGMWDAQKENTVTDEQVAMFSEKISGTSPAYENFCSMSMSVKRTYTRRYLSFKTEESRRRDLEKIIDRLNRNLGPM